MSFRPTVAVWETTSACNMQCRHCGSKCSRLSSHDLNTHDALLLCDQLAEIGLQFITLSGGEPLLRSDWRVIARKLSDLGVMVNMITNGWLIDEMVIDHAWDAGISNIAVSLDGLETTHDLIRRQGSYARVLRSLEIMSDKSFPSTVTTTVTKWNLTEMPRLRMILEDLNVNFWQFQMGVPIGNLELHRTGVIAPPQMGDIIDFAFDLLEKSTIRPCIADCLGYYTVKSEKIRESISGPIRGWRGCQAGKSAIGILHDGRITGCTSIRDDRFVAGSILDKPLYQIWSNPEAFAWNRERTRENLTGFCRKCQAGDVCLGGCCSVMLATTGDLKENHYCQYRISMEKIFSKIGLMSNIESLITRAKKAIELDLHEIAEMCLLRAYGFDQGNCEILTLLGYVSFKLKDYSVSLSYNKKLLSKDGLNVKAWKGIGLSLVKIGHLEDGIRALRHAVDLTCDDYLDPYHDLSAVLLELGRKKEALEVLKQGRRKSTAFKEQSRDLHIACLQANEEPSPPGDMNH